jgi:carbonic anhydrase
MSVIDELTSNNAAYAREFPGPQPARPSRGLAIVTCMDARIDVLAMLGIDAGAAHVIRNAGGIITDAEIRSLTVSQRLLGTREVMLVHHTDCGMLGLPEDEFTLQLREDVGMEPPWEVGAFADLDEDVRSGIALIRASPFVPHTDAVRGFVLDIATGRLREVT